MSDLLAGLEPSEAAAGARGALASALYRETEGNPLFVREILTHLVEEGRLYRKDGHWTSDATSASQLGIPEGVREVIGRRLSRLSDPCQKILTIAAAIGGGFSWSTLHAVSEQDEDVVLDLLDEALAAQLISEGRADAAGTFDFTHALIHQTLYEALSTPRRVLLHERIADALERLYAANLDHHVIELANHYYLAAHGGRSIKKAIEYARRAALRSAAQYAYDESIAHYERALELLDLSDSPDAFVEIELLLELTDQLWNTGEYAKARKSAGRAGALAATANAGELMARAAIAYSSNEPLSFNVGFVDYEEVELLERALALVSDDSSMRPLLLSRLAERIAYTDQHERRRTLAREAVAIARTLGDRDVLARVLAGAVVALREPALLEERIQLVKELRRLAGDAAEPRSRAMGELLFAVESLEAGDIDEARQAFANLDTWAQRTRRTYERWMVACARVAEALMAGRFADADREAEGALAAGLSEQNQNAIGVYGAQLFFLRREQGRLSEILPVLQSYIEQYPLLRAWRCALATVHIELDDLSAAREAFDELAAHDFEDVQPDIVWLLSMCLLSGVAYRIDDERRSDRLYTLLVPYAGRNVTATPVGPCLGSSDYYIALAAAGARRFDDAERHFRNAIVSNERMGMPALVAWCRSDYAQVLFRRNADGDGAKAAALCDSALQTARALGMVALLARVEAFTHTATGFIA